jgi:pSer/pThr/pTyr-binding forkhead associated (FHA) protein
MQKSRFTIGRDRNADVPIADPSVSRLHAEATLLDGDRVFLTDCNSSNGTFVIRNGAATPVRQETLRSGDDVQFGSVILAVADLLEVFRAHTHRAFSPPKGQSSPLRHSNKLVRCECGAVKNVADRCSFCGA